MKYNIICKNNEISIKKWYFLMKLMEDCKIDIMDRGCGGVDEAECKKGDYILWVQYNNYDGILVSKWYIDKNDAEELIKKYNDSIEEYEEGVEEWLEGIHC